MAEEPLNPIPKFLIVYFQSDYHSDSIDLHIIPINMDNVLNQVGGTNILSFVKYQNYVSSISIP